MPRTLVPVQFLLGGYADAGLLASGTVADTVNLNAAQWQPGYEMMLVVHNGTGGGRNVTITSAQAQGRTNDLLQGMGSPATYLFGPFPEDGWKQADGRLWFQVDGPVNVSVFAVIPPA